MSSSKRTANEVLGDQPAVKVQKVKIEQGVEKASKIMVDCVAKICDCMEGQNIDEILKIITVVVPSDELVNSLVPDNTLVMRTGNAVDAGIPRVQRIKNSHALLDKALQHYESKEDVPRNLSADLAVFGLAMLTTSPDHEVAEFFREFMQDIDANIVELVETGFEHLKDTINTPAGMNICRACVRIYIKIADPSNKLEFAKAAQTVLKEVRKNYETYSRDITTIIDYYLVAIVVG
jgi:hypothetical protein